MPSECSADLKPVVWVQGGTFGYTETFKLYTDLPYCNTPPNITGRLLLTILECEKIK